MMEFVWFGEYIVQFARLCENRKTTVWTTGLGASSEKTGRDGSLWRSMAWNFSMEHEIFLADKIRIFLVRRP
jgi:hypothetical protein